MNFLGVPLSFIHLHVDLRDQLSRAAAQHVRCQQQSLVYEAELMGRVMLVLQGRIEGVHLAWFEQNDQKPDSDEQLNRAAELWQQRVSP